jgi:hypothetical protein
MPPGKAIGNNATLNTQHGRLRLPGSTLNIEVKKMANSGEFWHFPET